PYQSLFEEALRRAEREEFARRIWGRDPTFWKASPEHQKIINNSLGWLTVAEWTAQRVDQIETFAREVREAGFTHLMLLGMGGSSLCPEVFRRTFPRREGFPELLVLDTTDPDTIADYESRVDLEKTLFMVSSKSGSTIEPLSFYKYFFERVRSLKNDQAGENFIAITDPGTLMERIAREAKFRQIFPNPPDIGGRYSALSYFGMLPATLMGLDTSALLQNAIAAMEASAASVPTQANAALRLGCALGALAKAGRDKLTLVTSRNISSLGLWIEQLVAESTGKEGKGIVPVVAEPLGPPEAYGNDRVFVVVSAGPLDEETESNLRSLEDKGHPVVRRNLSDPLNLCAEFFIWELATAVAGRLLEINPFDQPNVQESKDNTNSLLAEFKKNGSLPEQALLASANGLNIYGATNGRTTAGATPSDVIKDHLAREKPGDYIALLGYIQETNARNEQLVAESTGKEGKGMVPVVAEPPGPPEAYGNDRVFVVVSAGPLDEETESRLRSLEDKGHPVVRR
ncbi:MAG: hypothetical protein LC627_04865, partial [Verrucomicrobiaceae bacterium]|nr:hypothetical protein [Verrucomicrobiaceae bacterium]